MEARKSAALVAGLALVLGSCSIGSSPPKEVQFLDGQFSMMKPGSWSMLSNLNDKADLQMGNPFREAYCTVLTESKEDFRDDFSLEEFGEITRGTLLSSVQDASSDGPESLDVNGQRAIRYELAGSVDNVKVRYWHIVVDADSHFHQVILWSLPSKFEGNRSDFEMVLGSLKKVG